MKKVLFFCLILSLVPALWAQNKYALVIGNSNYKGISTLKNPVNDANDMAAALQSLGFNVEKVINGDLNQMLTAVANLKRKLGASRNSYGFFFYAGHGVQSNGENYLIPVNATNIQNENHLRQFAVSVQVIMDDLAEAGNVLNIIVLDACRDNPFAWKRSGSRGLSVVSHTPVGSMLMYATSANSVADDGGSGRNGLFTTQLLKNIKTPGLSVLEVFNKTGQDVLEASNGKQYPEISIKFFDVAYLGSRPSPNPSPTPTPTPTPSPTPTPTPTPAPTPTPTPTPAPTPTPSPASAGFVRINGGTFMMGSPKNEGGYADVEGQHRVTVSSFSMGIYPVTQKEYEEVMGSNPSKFRGPNLPVEQVSWFDAIEYCNRRSQREGLTPVYSISGSGEKQKVTWNRKANGYRLPTEAEWEYACRAGTTGPFNTGDKISTNQANYYWDSYKNVVNETSRQSTTDVGSYPPNPWGLYDMHGNVSEWCWDWYGVYGTSARTDPMGASSGDRRITRGGNWAGKGLDLRSAARAASTPSTRLFFYGFRLVRNAQ